MSLKHISLSDVCTIKHGCAFKGEYFSETKTKDILLTPGNFKIGGGFKKDKLKYYDGPIDKDYILKPNDLIVTMTDLSKKGDTLGFSALVPKDDNIYLHNQRIGLIENINRDIIDKNYLYWVLRDVRYHHYVVSSATGTTVKHTSPKTILKYEFDLPSIEEQKFISGLLCNIELKITINENVNKNLFSIVSSLQTEWMVNFTPFKSTKFKSSAFGLIPENWNVGKLGDVIELFDSKRIPLSGKEREDMEKIYPYYGAASLMDYVDDYIFDGIYLLIGEDGTVIDDKGFPILQYVWGKFWVNNHAHIIKGKNGFNVDSLYLLLSKTNIQSIVTGAVQPKVNQGNLKSIEIIIPPVDVMEKFNKLIKPFFDTIRSNNDEIKKLEKLRDTLLPKLMAGEIDVSKINYDFKNSV